MSDTDRRAGAERTNLVLQDPTNSLPEPAQEIVRAAKRLLLEGGFDALKLDAIVGEAGKNKSSVKYYFGNKDGLILAMLKSLDYDQCLQLAEQTRDAVGEERLRQFINGQTEIAGDADSFLMFFDVLPHVARDESLRPRVAETYDWYYQMNLRWLDLERRVNPENRADLLAFAALMVAVVDGLALQAALKPEGLDVPRALRVLGFFLERSLDAFVESVTGATTGVADPGSPSAPAGE